MSNGSSLTKVSSTIDLRYIAQIARMQQAFCLKGDFLSHSPLLLHTMRKRSQPTPCHHFTRCPKFSGCTLYTGWSKKSALLFFFIPLMFYIFFFHIFQVIQTTALGDSFDTNMDPTGCYSSQQRVKIIEEYLVTKSVLTQRQCRRNFGKNSAGP